MASLVEEHFIRETLEEAAVHIYKSQTDAIQRAVSSASTGHLLRNRFFNVGDTTIEHRHPIYERFLDMKRLQRNGKVVKRTPLHIQNRFMWGLYLRIRDRLMYGLTEDVREKCACRSVSTNNPVWLKNNSTWQKSKKKNSG